MNPGAMELFWLTETQKDTLPVLFLHGFTGCWEDWDVVRNHDRFPACAVDLPGHGAHPSVLPVGSWLDETARLLANTLDENGIDRVQLVGYSLGGRVGLHFSTCFPERVNKLVIESSHPGLQTKKEQEERLDHDRKWASLFESAWPEVLHSWYEQPVFESSQGRITSMIEQKIKNDPSILSAALLGFSLSHQPRIEPRNHACLYIAGQRDTKYVAIGKELAGLYQNVTLKVVEDAGHNVHFERPEQYLEVITQFLE